MAEWKELRRAAGEDVPDSDIDQDEEAESSDDEQEMEQKVDETENLEKQPSKSKAKASQPQKRPQVKYFQTALSNVYGRLPPTLRKSYEKEAIAWKMKGPDEATKRKLAEKYLARLARHFADTVHKQMGVRLAMLVTYVVPNGNTAASFIDYTEEFGGRSFSKDFGLEIEKSAILTYWGAYAKGEFDDGEESDRVDEAQIRKRGKPLLKLELNKYGEPIIPDPTVIPAGEQPNQYLPRLIRNIVIHNYGQHCSLASNVIWALTTLMAENVRDFISSEYLPDDLVQYWKEPTGITVKPARKILQFWYGRQQQKQIPLEIHSYWDGEALVPREPRQQLAIDDQDPDFEDDVETLHVPLAPKTPKKLGGKGRKKQQRAKVREDDVAVEAPGRPNNGELNTAQPTEPLGEETAVGTTDGHSVKRIVATRRGRNHQIIRSDTESDAAPPLQAPSFPVTAPVTPPHLSSRIAVDSALEKLAADPDLAMLDESVRNLALGVLKRHINRSPSPSGSLREDLMQVDSPTTSKPPQPPTPSNDLITSSDPSLQPSAASTSLPLPMPTNETTSDAIPTPTMSQLPPPVKQVRRRKTEEEYLLETAKRIGAKSGPRKSRKTAKWGG
ncbi:hypothetical protein EST38_g10590 [Candolleomyces aberdarensis]|uniref:Uncharacterized protein n=1 Tax=Candolleomyces aberdarensis TaxID=2316362 RepID=A0A4Q2D707_9AGAR|nr:hypothetical protein EST38_g10590 [Candolleomyces aberdarensis]